MKRAAALAFALFAATAAAVPAGTDLEAAAMTAAQTLGGVLRSCPASFAGIGSAEKRCVGAGGSVEEVRVKLSGALKDQLYGVWRSRDEQRSVYNWLNTAGGYVYLRLQTDPDGRAQTLIYLDLPPAQATAQPPPTQLGNVTLTPAPTVSPTPEPSAPAEASVSAPLPTAPAPAPETAPSSSTTPPAPSPAPVPFGRALSLQNRRLSGPDVLAVQNRLIALMRPVRAGQGDGWYGPVTARTVRVFQKANGLPVTGAVDRVTWERLFSASAGGFSAPTTP